MIKILFLAANPSDIHRLQVDEEQRGISLALRLTDFGDQFDLIPELAVRATDLQDLLQHHKPHIVHFSGHGTAGGEILLQDQQGNATPVSPESLSNLFRLFKDSVHCVVLSACYSDSQALSIAQHIGCVIGMSEEISDSAAQNFSDAFYRALGSGRSVQDAYDLGCSQIEVSKLNEQHKPKLITTRTDPAQIVFAGSASIFVKQERIEYLNQLKQTSIARCIGRWQTILPRSDAIDFSKDLNVGQLRPEYEANTETPLIVLVAELGTGKSLIIEKLFQKAVDNALVDTSAPIPIYLTASECAGKLMQWVEQKILATKILGNIHKQGVTVFVDEVDGGGLLLAETILAEARILKEAWPKSAVTLASRPLYVFTDIEESVKVPPMSEEEAIQLISLVSGQKDFWLHSWPKSIQDAIRRPLFALLLGVYRKRDSNKTLRSTGELISDFIKHALGRINRINPTTNRLLEKLAALSINRAGIMVPTNEIATDEEIHLLVESRLLTENSGAVGFTLPILTEWFAAHSLLHGYPSPEYLLANAKILEQWRYPLIIFVAIFNYEQVSTIFTPLCEQYPAFASEILKESISKWGEPEHDTFLAETEYGIQIRTTMQAWVNGIGPLAKLIAPVDENSTILPLGIAQDNQFIDFAWYNGKEDLPEISNLLDKVIIESPEWSPVVSTKLGRQSAWLWKEIQESLVQELSGLLNKGKLPVTDGPLVAEEDWETALVITSGKSLNPKPIPLAKLEFCLQKFPEDMPDEMIVQRNGMIGNRKVSSLSIKRLKAQLTALHKRDELTLKPPWPMPDLSIPSGHHIWELYSNEQLLERIRVVYQAVIESYTQLVNMWFPKFSPRLQTALTLPARFTGILDIPEESEARGPRMQWYWDPLPSDVQSIVDIHLDRIPWDLDISKFHNKARKKLRLLRPTSEKRMYTSLHATSIMETLQSTPIKNIVYQWLWNDLKRVSWVTGVLRPFR